MQDARTHRSVNSRLDVEFPQRPDAWRRIRARWCWLATLAPLGILGWWVLRGEQRPFQARPVAKPHELIADNCQSCHLSPFQSVTRFAAGGASLRQLENNACRSCHAEQTDDHHGPFAPVQHSCFDCHREHLPAHDLAGTPDSYCVACHNDLSAGVASSLVNSVPSFATHPEFAILRNSPAFPATHLAAPRVERNSDGNGLRDATKLHFSHKAHLSAELPLHRGHPEFRSDHRTKRLECTDCHTLDQAGQYMLPISYQRHCAACHPLSFSSQLVEGGPLPHGDPQAAYGVIRERLLRYYREHLASHTGGSEEVAQQKANTNRLPFLTTHPAGPAARDEFEWAQLRMAEIQIGTHGAGIDLPSVVRQGCEYCHMTEPISDRSDELLVPWRIARGSIEPDDPLIPPRWMPHSRFRHDRHDLVVHGFRKEVDSCTVCHAQASTSDSTQSILMPSVSVCQQCHGIKSGQAVKARSDCVECHAYHHVTEATAGSYRSADPE